MRINLETRRGDWMQTFTGRAVYPLDPRPSDLNIEGIAHSLSMQCRYAGHSWRFYSVAEHCVLMAQHYITTCQNFDPIVAKQMLMHDSTEAYLVDLPRPLKSQMPNYRDHEARMWEAVAARFGLPVEVAQIVKEYDERILNDEKEALMGDAPMPWLLRFDQPLGVEIRGLSPSRVKIRFLDLANFLRIE